MLSSDIRKISLDLAHSSDQELSEMADFLASQIDGLDDESVCYGAYVGLAVRGEKQKIISRLLPKLVLNYRKRMIAWFEHALLKRANVGGGGVGIKKVEEQLANFVESIPRMLVGKMTTKLSEYVDDTEYFHTSKLDPVGFKIIHVIYQDALKAGLALKAPKLAMTQKYLLKYDNLNKRYYIPSDMNTYADRKNLKALGFSWDVSDKVWWTTNMNSMVESLFTMDSKPIPLDIEKMSEWYFTQWLPININRFTKIFSDFVKNDQSSYKVLFSISGKEVHVSMERQMTTALEAVEELRYRYTGRHGREPWLEVMARFVELVDTKSPSKIPAILDRMNNLQHSNGLFMEHFPSSVKSWYEEFLNAKYHTPTADELAKFIPDRDLRDLMIELTDSSGLGHRPMDWRFQPPADYQHMTKSLADIGTKIDWRKKQYPKMKGYTQVNRFSPSVQNGLEALKELDEHREKILSTEIHTEQDYEQVMDDVHTYVEQHEALVAELRANLERQRQAELSKPDAADIWMSNHFTEEFVRDYPYAGDPSDLKNFISKYGSHR